MAGHIVFYCKALEKIEYMKDLKNRFLDLSRRPTNAVLLEKSCVQGSC